MPTKYNYSALFITILNAFGVFAALISPNIISARQLNENPIENEFLYIKSENQTFPPTYAIVGGENIPVYKNPSDELEGVAPVRIMKNGFNAVSLENRYPILWKKHAWYLINKDEYVRADNLHLTKPSNFQGVTVPPSFDKSLGWIIFDTKASKNPGEPPPAEDPPTLLGETVAIIYETKEINGNKWCRIGEGWWINYSHLGLVTPSPRPKEVKKTDKWIEINLFEQTLIAYEGDRMVFTTLISSGDDDFPTVEGLFRIWTKSKKSKMSGKENDPLYYYIEDVPWQMYFHKSYALHTSYWHGYFGLPSSHGCINMSPKDAKWLFDWSGPLVKENNWTKATKENPGTWVWVHK